MNAMWAEVSRLNLIELVPALQMPASVSSRVLAGARTTGHNAFKVPLVERTLAGVISEARA